jgi:hypothetical protein
MALQTLHQMQTMKNQTLSCDEQTSLTSQHSTLNVLRRLCRIAVHGDCTTIESIQHNALMDVYNGLGSFSLAHTHNPV